jgi:hypothetical protein
VTSYAYGNVAGTQTATTGTRKVVTKFDGLGRAVRVETWDVSGAQVESIVETLYDVTLKEEEAIRRQCEDLVHAQADGKGRGRYGPEWRKYYYECIRTRVWEKP